MNTSDNDSWDNDIHKDDHNNTIDFNLVFMKDLLLKQKTKPNPKHKHNHTKQPSTLSTIIKNNDEQSFLNKINISKKKKQDVQSYISINSTDKEMTSYNKQSSSQFETFFVNKNKNNMSYNNDHSSSNFIRNDLALREFDDDISS